MGFGSYDESEQDNQEVETDFDDDEAVDAHQSDHQGAVEFEFGGDDEALLDQLEEIKSE